MPLLPDGEAEINLKEARQEFANKPAIVSLKRWIRDGFGSRGKLPPVFLDGHKDGHSYVTSREAVARFKQALKMRSQ